MTEPIAKTQLKAAELEAAILKRLSEHPDCAGISYVYVKATGLEPPDETWKHIMVSRHPATPRTLQETKAMLAVLGTMRREFDLLPD